VWPSGHVGEIEVEPVGGPGLSSVVVRVKLAGDAWTAVPASVIAKFASAMPETRQVMHALGSYGCEVSSTVSWPISASAGGRASTQR
jgi:hypothetical protein